MLDRIAPLASLALILALVACQKGDSQNAGGTGGAGGGGGAGGVETVLCGSCAQVFSNGGVPCDTSASELFDALTWCACNTCGAACGASLCSQKPSSATCGACLEQACGYEVQECAKN